LPPTAAGALLTEHLGKALALRFPQHAAVLALPGVLRGLKEQHCYCAAPSYLDELRAMQKLPETAGGALTLTRMGLELQRPRAGLGVDGGKRAYSTKEQHCFCAVPRASCAPMPSLPEAAGAALTPARMALNCSVHQLHCGGAARTYWNKLRAMQKQARNWVESGCRPLSRP
jgi:hypothetical protein